MGYPAMAVAACFGGPMLNILLGVGLSGTYLILLVPARGQPIHVAMGRTLSVSGFGLLAILLATLIFVPLNGYRMSKRVGATLIVAYLVRSSYSQSCSSIVKLTSSPARSASCVRTWPSKFGYSVPLSRIHVTNIVVKKRAHSTSRERQRAEAGKVAMRVESTGH